MISIFETNISPEILGFILLFSIIGIVLFTLLRFVITFLELIDTIRKIILEILSALEDPILPLNRQNGRLE